jgi:hypothetical protein
MLQKDARTSLGPAAFDGFDLLALAAVWATNR